MFALIALTATLAIQVLVVLVVLGIAWYFLSPYIAEPFSKMVIVIAVLLFCIWLLRAFGVL